LGWYGTIARQYETDISDLTYPLVLAESGEPPALTVGTQPATQATGRNEQLLGPYNTRPRYYEIAPSRTVPYEHHAAQTDEDAKNRGIIIHSMLEKLALNSSLSANQMKKLLPINLAVQQFEDYWHEAQQVINHQNFRHLFDAEYFDKAYTEVPVMYQEGETTVYGIIDRMVVSKDTVHVVDYKTHQHAEQANLPGLVEQYRSQMALYAKAVQKLWPGYRIQACLLFTHCTCLEAVTL
jgi:ATP-dependent helicase/nuclease subunit A